jgi:hypothetical protein
MQVVKYLDIMMQKDLVFLFIHTYPTSEDQSKNKAMQCNANTQRKR